MDEASRSWLKPVVHGRAQIAIAVLAIVAIAVHLVLRYALEVSFQATQWPLIAALVLGGLPLVWDLSVNLVRREFGSDLLAGISIVTSVILEEYLAGTLVVLMLSGGEALEGFAVRGASSVLDALARRMPSIAHRRGDAQELVDVALDDIAVGDTVVVLPHEMCPVDGTVLEGHGSMDESYLTGEPYIMSKSPGSSVLSGAINGERALTICADKLAIDSRFAKIMEVMRVSQQQRPRIRRLGDQLGAVYTPVAVAVGVFAWVASADPLRFLAVMVVATPCPLLIAIPVAIIGSISLAAKRAIVIRDPAVLETVETCNTIIFDKTGTLTYGAPNLTEIVLVREDESESELLALAASIEQYSKHPLAAAVVNAARERGLPIAPASEIHERPGEGLQGVVSGRDLEITSRKHLAKRDATCVEGLPEQTGGLECVLLVDGKLAATVRFRDTPRRDGEPFVRHLGPRHRLDRVMLVSGDRESEVRYLAELVGIEEVHADQSPEDKVAIVRAETERARTIFVGDGINDAPALLEATVGIAFGQNSDVTTEAAGAVIMDSSLAKVDEFLHISQRMRRIALQSAVGGMLVSVVGMVFAALGYLPPVAGAITQEIIDIVAVVNALRVALLPKSLTDF